ncbi:uncharacterized protein LOC124899627 [Capsicum annuum]|uniref:uncharacterized protein LOC124899627 n=1 Tax=Capsicum annuum TaxID=4072 RepID=UPI001FB0FE81|nr:uncharacterized protein LOC124899627 [Capsicum annuum]
MDVETVKCHLYQSGFIENYFIWKHKGERDDRSETSYGNALHGGGHPIFKENPYRQMNLDVASPNFSQGSSWKSYSNGEPESSHPFQHSMEEDPNPISKKIYDLLDAADAELYPGSSLSQLAVVSRILNIKIEKNMSQRGYNQMMQLLKESLPEDNIVLDNYYQTKKLVRSLGLPVEKIDRSQLHYKKIGCSLLPHSHPRIVVNQDVCCIGVIMMNTLHLVNFVASQAADMRWHHEHKKEDSVRRHPSDSEAWKNFNEIYPFFAAEPRNVRLGLCTDGFQPFSQSGRKYSSWPVIVTPYNLPLGMCMKEVYMFLTIIVPGKLACPYCMEETQSFRLQHGRKQSWFDCQRMFLDQHHPFRRDRKNFLKVQIIRRPPPTNRIGEEILDQICNLGIRNVTELDAEQVNKIICNTCGWKKRSIFWDLPYWSSNMIQNNLDVMHIEKNFFDNVFNTVLNFDDKTKDNPQSRLDTAKYCDQPQLGKDSTDQYPKAVYTLDKEARAILFNWVKCLKFPDGYVSNLGRLLETNAKRLFGMKSHDCHVFMQ